MTTPILLISLAPTFIIGVVLLMMPRVRAGILFGSSVPVEFVNSEPGQAIVNRYRTHVFVVLFAAIFASGAAVMYAKPRLLSLITYAVLPLFGWAWVRAWRATQAFAIKVPLRRSASLLPARARDGFSLVQLAALVPLAGAAIYLQLHWLQIPPRFVVHWGADGVANGWAGRTVASVFGPLIIGALLLAAIGLLTFLVSRAQPAQARQMRPILAVVGWMMSALFTGIALHPLSANPGAGPQFIFWIVGAGMVALFATLSYVLHLSHRDGSDRNRSDAWDGTPDSGWRWGMIYYNPADAAVLVKNRFGLGWTLNFGNPQAKLWCGGMLVLIAVEIAVVLAVVFAGARP